jgi:AcrR family transcriptional regulator
MTPPVRRRSPGEGRELLLEAARQVFSERGYAGASTREIAERAEVAEGLLFRNFGSKAALFTEVVVGVFEDFVGGWRDLGTERLASWSDEELAREFIGRLYDVMAENRGLMISYIATGVFDPEVVSLDRAPTFIGALDRLARWSEREFVEHRHLPRMNILVANRAIVGMILSLALFDDWLLPAGKDRPTRDEVIEELAALILYGVDRPGRG